MKHTQKNNKQNEISALSGRNLRLITAGISGTVGLKMNVMEGSGGKREDMGHWACDRLRIHHGGGRPRLSSPRQETHFLTQTLFISTFVASVSLVFFNNGLNCIPSKFKHGGPN